MWNTHEMCVLLSHAFSLEASHQALAEVTKTAALSRAKPEVTV